MRRTSIASLVLGAASAVLVALPATIHAAPESPEEIETCVRNNLPRQSSIQTVQLRSTNRVGDTAESIAKIHWMVFEDDLSKVLLRFERPLDMRGAGVLLIEKKERSPDTFLYLPEVGKVRRVSSGAAASSLFGTDFSYEDFNRLVGMSGASTSTRDPDTEVDGRGAWVLTIRPAPEDESAYERVVMTVDKQTCVALRTESWEPGEQLRKVLTADPTKIEQQGSLWIPRQLTMRDQRDETQTEVIVEEIDTNATIKPKMFSARELEAGSH